MLDERKHLFDYLAQVILVFGITLLVITFICCLTGDDAKEYSTMFALGSAGIPIYTIFQFLLSSACITALRFLFFTDTVIRKMSIVIRTILMLISVIALVGIFAYIFGWFPVDEPRCWISFIISFGICFVIATVISVLKEAMDNKQLAVGLKNLKEEQNGSTDRSR